MRRLSGAREALDLEAKHGPTDHRSWLSCAPRGVELWNRMQVRPRAQTDLTVPRVGRRRGVRWLGPGRGIVAGKLRTMTPRSPRRRLAGGVGGETAARAQTDEQTHLLVGQGVAELDRLIPGVKRENGQCGGGMRLLQPRADLLGRHQIEVLSRDDAAHAQRSGPA